MSSQKEKPIIFSLDMVHAILENRKSQTRRVVKPQPTKLPEGKYRYMIDSVFHKEGFCIDASLIPAMQTIKWVTEAIGKFSYGKVGSCLWVRETYCFSHEALLYKADHDKELPPGYKWKSPIFMPRKFSRIILEITDIRVERLQEITAHDCVKEGCDRMLGTDPHYHPRDRFKDLWNSIHREGIFDWENNPWVWVISFKRLTAPKNG